MPNWCSNFLEVSGTDFQKFCQDVKCNDSEFSLKSLIPIPETYGLSFDHLKNILTTQQLNECCFNNKGEDDWYEFCCSRWGTKWDVSELSFDEYDDSINYSFDTAWSPPEEWLINISQRYECIFELTSYEEGCDFWFHLIIENGNIKKRETMSIKEKILYEIKNNPESTKSFNKFINKLDELEYIEDTNIEEIDELREIVDEIDCEFGTFSLYNVFDEIRTSFYENKSSHQ